MAMRKRKKHFPTVLAPNLEVSEQLILLLERLLASDLKLSYKVLTNLDSKFKFFRANADVQHRLEQTNIYTFISQILLKIYSFNITY